MADYGDDGTYRQFIDTLFCRYIRLRGGPPLNLRDLDTFAAGIAGHYMRNTDPGAADLANRLLENNTNVKITDAAGASPAIAQKKFRYPFNSDYNDRRAVQLNGKFGPRNFASVRRYAAFLALQNVFYKPSLRYKQQVRNKSYTASGFIYRRAERPEPGSGRFEKDFKRQVLRDRGGNVPSAAKTVISRLSDSDKADLARSLKARGINTVQDLEGLLHKWKEEALGRGRPRKISRSRSRGLSLSPGISR